MREERIEAPVAALAAVVLAGVIACDRGPPAPRGAAATPAIERLAQADGGAAPASRPGDATLTARVRTALRADPLLKGKAVGVDTRDGTVTLTGALDSDDAVARAVDVARGVEGVANVVNRLTVKNEDKAARSSRG